MINIYVCLLETARSLKFNARFNPTVFHIALLSLLLCTIHTRYITIKFNASRPSPQLVRAIRVSRGRVSRRMFARVYATEAFESYARKRTREEKLICIFNADLACIYNTEYPSSEYFAFSIKCYDAFLRTYETYFAKYISFSARAYIGNWVDDKAKRRAVRR